MHLAPAHLGGAPPLPCAPCSATGHQPILSARGARAQNDIVDTCGVTGCREACRCAPACAQRYSNSGCVVRVAHVLRARLCW